MLHLDDLQGEEHFTDKAFPAEYGSLAKGELDKFKSITWKRASEFMPKAVLFSGLIEPRDIRQGMLGDCYFLSALISLSERLHIIRHLFENEGSAAKGLYAVWLNIDGQWKQTVLDDMIPLLDGQPAFTSSQAQELWVMLL
jgi:calpain-15